VAFEAEPDFQRPDDGLDPLPQPAGEIPGLLLAFAGPPDQGQVQVLAGQERLGVLAGQAIVRHDGSAARGPVRRPAPERLAGLLS